MFMLTPEACLSALRPTPGGVVSSGLLKRSDLDFLSSCPELRDYLVPTLRATVPDMPSIISFEFRLELKIRPTSGLRGYFLTDPVAAASCQ